MGSDKNSDSDNKNDKYSNNKNESKNNKNDNKNLLPVCKLLEFNFKKQKFEDVKQTKKFIKLSDNRLSFHFRKTSYDSEIKKLTIYHSPGTLTHTYYPSVDNMCSYISRDIVNIQHSPIHPVKIRSYSIGWFYRIKCMTSQ